jgi:hypothetical protein
MFIAVGLPDMLSVPGVQVALGATVAGPSPLLEPRGVVASRDRGAMDVAG